MLKNKILMIEISFKRCLKSVFSLVLLFIYSNLMAQQQPNNYNSTNNFWQHVQFGGGIGLGFGSGYTDISVAPSAIYNFNEYIALGLGAQYSYLKQRNSYAAHLYGGKLISLFNPIPQIQFSAELEQLRVNINEIGSNTNSNAYWNTALFVGAGYRNGNATLGARYNVLKDNNNIYGSAFMPFIRFYF
jgi:hypothetical protein